MQPMNCPSCGAAAHLPPGVTVYQCPYCHRTSNFGAPPPQQPYGPYAPPPQYGPPPQQAAPPEEVHRVVVVSPTYTYSSGWSIYWMVRLGIAALVLAIAGGGWAWHKLTGRPNPVGDVDDDDWSGKEPLVCSGVDDISVSNVKASFTAGSAIIADGNCKVTCKQCDLRAPVAIMASGNAQVAIVDGRVEGQTSIIASGNAHVDVRGNATVSGPFQKTANGQVTGVSAAPSASVAAASSAPPRASAPAAHPTTAPAKPAASGKKK